jgi:hypothetical protein
LALGIKFLSFGVHAWVGVDVGCFDCKCFCPLHWRIYCSYLAYLPYLFTGGEDFFNKCELVGRLALQAWRRTFWVKQGVVLSLHQLFFAYLFLACIYLQHVKLIDALLLGFDRLEGHICGLEKSIWQEGFKNSPFDLWQK